MADILYKFPQEQRVFTWDFSLFQEIAVENDTITSVVSLDVTPADELTLGTPTIDGAQVKCLISDGEPDTQYTLDLLIETSSGARIMGQTFLYSMAEN